ncbi:MAG: aldolase/citrate lyase family protein [Actinomycetota bacterium]|nr:aldolase/citrate lyase family protein [Actinomycetota bacterium]
MNTGHELRSALEEHPLVGTFVKLARPELIDLMAMAGFDFIVLDLEHGQSAYSEVRETLLAARANGVPTLVRLGAPDHALTNRLLEAGASGIQLSNVTSARLAHGLRASLRYQPVGDRSISLSQPAAKYGATDLHSYLAEHTSAPLVVGQFETVEYEDDLDDIVRHLDVAFIGPTDLSVAAQTPGTVTGGAAADVIAAVEESTRRTGVHLGTFAGTPEGAQWAVERGYRYVVVSSDLALIGAASRTLRATIGGLR